MIYSTDATVEEYGKREFFPWMFPVGFSHYPRDRWVFQQFTGLLDKNGKEIYEGDVLKHDLWGVSEIIWEHGMFRGKSPKSLEENGHDVTLADHQLQRSKVIGNVWEHPELLKERNK